jgi:opacity protein-like surface antigen
MRKALFSGVVAAALAISPTVAAASEFYVSLFAGFSQLESGDDDFDFSGGGGGGAGFDDEGGLIFGGAAGMEVFPNLRGEVEVSFQQFDDLDNVYSCCAGTFDFGTSIEALYFLTNLWYDFQVNDYIHPYVGAGLGGAWVEARSSDIAGAGPEDEDIGFAWQLGAGVRIPVMSNVDFDIGYRFKAIAGLELDDLSGPGVVWDNGNLYSHSATAAIIVHFGRP